MTSDTEELSATGQVVRQCSKCHRPCKGHAGPYGKDCQMPPIDGSTEPDSLQDQIHDQAISTRLLAQLITQMTDMNVNIQAMARGQRDITAALTSHAAIGSARQPSETVAATTPNFNLPPPASEKPVTARSTETQSRLATSTFQQGADPKSRFPLRRKRSRKRPRNKTNTASTRLLRFHGSFFSARFCSCI